MATPVTVGLLHPGEMGSAIGNAARLVDGIIIGGPPWKPGEARELTAAGKSR
ncbi:MAG: hypothetical protein HY071_02540 [Chloroflexi bacterium]|nr:hypothetical protein [Chloroflexota bacterium]